MSIQQEQEATSSYHVHNTECCYFETKWINPYLCSENTQAFYHQKQQQLIQEALDPFLNKDVYALVQQYAAIKQVVCVHVGMKLLIQPTTQCDFQERIVQRVYQYPNNQLPLHLTFADMGTQLFSVADQRIQSMDHNTRDRKRLRLK